jgi:hypothetical protein
MPKFIEDVEIIGHSLIIKEPAELDPFAFGQVRIRIQPQNDTVAIFDGNGRQALSFNSRFAVLEVGGKWLVGEGETPPVGGGSEGDISVYDEEGRIRVHINGRDGSIRFHDTEETQRIRISGEHGAIKVSDSTLAIEFDIEADDLPNLEPGMVMVLVEGEPVKVTRFADFSEDNKVVGVLMDGPRGIILDHDPSSTTRWPIAVAGKVECKVDADIAPIALGDLLAVSESTPGHAQKMAGFHVGSTLGKALKALPAGKEKIPILLTL